MDPARLADELRPIRLPVDYATLGVSDALAAFALGVVLALLVFALLRPFLSRRIDPAMVAAREVEALRGAPPAARLLGLARLLSRLDPERRQPRPAGLDAALYRPGTAADFAALEADILGIAGRRREGR
ncbi:hypothetical protein [Acuticoccus sediminis]|uniref:hypothetical protein n=1 Tax=Acuticoccus sediminis TaxID=2184697 RepID=UPI001CFE8713|nr:hypothetical protein [Acuticoccus sediminis]